jgi:SAM-dependent methyltransferase
MPKSTAPFAHAFKRMLMSVRRDLYGLRAYIPGLRDHHRFEAMVGPLGFWSELQAYQLRLLTANGLQPHHRLLDLGCGPLQGGIAFIKYLKAEGYVGIDLDPVRIDAAREQITRHRLGAKAPQVIVSSSFGKEELGAQTFDFIWASQILYYFNDAVMADLLGEVRRRLNPGGKFLGDIFALDHYEFRFPENPGKYIRHTPESLTNVARQQGMTVRCLGPIEAFGYPKRLSLRTNLLFEFTVTL